MKFYKVIILFCLIIPAAKVGANPYSGKIIKIQAVDIGNVYNSLYLYFDVTNSPCSSSNAVNRFTILNESQQNVALSALMVGKGIEEINYIIIKAN